MKLFLVLSDGQATVERGFSVNKNAYDVNLCDSHLIARLLMKYYPANLIGLQNITTGKELLVAARGERS